MHMISRADETFGCGPRREDSRTAALAQRNLAVEMDPIDICREGELRSARVLHLASKLAKVFLSAIVLAATVIFWA